MPKSLLIPALLLLAACNPCEERCRAESRNIDGCLHDWGLEWADLDASDAVDYRLSCVAAEEVYDAGLEPGARKVERALCQDLVNDLRLANDCDAVWDALIGYGD